MNMGGRKDPLFRIVKAAAHVLMPPLFHVEASGVENLPKGSAFILLPKHQRWEDIPLLGLVTPRPLYYIAKSELFDNPLNNWILKSLGGIPLNRQRPLVSRRYLQTAIGLLQEGEGIVVFPEGTYHRGSMGPGQVGMVRLILSRLSPPFIPVGIRYSRGGWRTFVRISFGKPVQADPEISPGRFLHGMMEEIAALSGLV